MGRAVDSRMEVFEWIFFLEGVVNLFSFAVLFVAPLTALRLLGVPNVPSPELACMTQWFASLVAILAYIGLTVPPTQRTIEALLLGDILWLVVGFDFSIRFIPVWTAATWFQLLVTIFLAVSRTAFLIVSREAKVVPSEKRSGRSRSRTPRRR